jgi:hypothetical protein
LTDPTGPFAAPAIFGMPVTPPLRGPGCGIDNGIAGEY